MGEVIRVSCLNFVLSTKACSYTFPNKDLNLCRAIVPNPLQGLFIIHVPFKIEVSEIQIATQVVMQETCHRQTT